MLKRTLSKCQTPSERQRDKKTKRQAGTTDMPVCLVVFRLSVCRFVFMSVFLLGGVWHYHCAFLCSGTRCSQWLSCTFCDTDKQFWSHALLEPPATSYVKRELKSSYAKTKLLLIRRNLWNKVLSSFTYVSHYNQVYSMLSFIYRSERIARSIR